MTDPPAAVADTIQNHSTLGLLQPAETISRKSHFGAVSMKKHLINKQLRKEKVEDVPSDISDDEWGEIQKYSQVLYEQS